jgi:hypothetical protein
MLGEGARVEDLQQLRHALAEVTKQVHT